MASVLDTQTLEAAFAFGAFLLVAFPGFANFA